MSNKLRDEAKMAQECGFSVRTVEGGYLLAGDSIALEQYTDTLISASQAREAALREKLEAVEVERIELHQLLSAETTAKFEYKQRAEAAEAIIKASQEQESVPADYVF